MKLSLKRPNDNVRPEYLEETFSYQQKATLQESETSKIKALRCIFKEKQKLPP